MNDLSNAALLGIDVGFSIRRPTTGIAWCIGDRFAAAKTHSDWARRKAALPVEIKYSLVAIDGPLLPAYAPKDAFRHCERTFIRGAFAKRCKPGLSHIGSGLKFRSAAESTARAVCSLLEKSSFPGPYVVANMALVEAFPNAFLGVLLPDEVYLQGGYRKRKKFDWLYEQAVKLSLFERLFEALNWRNSTLLGAIKTERDHERRAAYVCLITAAFAFVGCAQAVGDKAGGYFWLPSRDLWAPWALAALSRE